jgi:hypothetical protein
MRVRSVSARERSERRRRRGDPWARLDDRAGLLGDQLPRHDVGVVLERRQQDLVAALQAWRALGLRDEVDGLGGAAREDDFARRGGIHEAAHALARCSNIAWLPGSAGARRDARWRGASSRSRRRPRSTLAGRCDEAALSRNTSGLPCTCAREDREVAPHALRVEASGYADRVHGCLTDLRVRTPLQLRRDQLFYFRTKRAQAMRREGRLDERPLDSVCAVRRSMRVTAGRTHLVSSLPVVRRVCRAPCRCRSQLRAHGGFRAGAREQGLQ